MEKVLLDEKKNFYKGNMHCHSTQSDGKFSPAELKELYKSKGYSFLAITDHERIYDNSYLDDESFLTITSAEYAIKEFPDQRTGKNHHMKVCHLNLYAKDQHNTYPVCYSTLSDHWTEKEEMEQLVKTYGDFPRKYSKEGINEIIRMAKEKGFFVSYNHPRWSLENYSQYSGYEGLWGVEIYNTNCNAQGLFEYDIPVFDDFLRDGKSVFATSGDDNHNQLDDSFGTFVMVNAESLSYEKIINGLLSGQFYTSTGPEIYSLVIKDNTVRIKCSHAKQITLSTGGRYTESVSAKENGYVTEAAFALRDSFRYFRLDVIDEQGNRANTQAYFL